MFLGLFFPLPVNYPNEDEARQAVIDGDAWGIIGFGDAFSTSLYKVLLQYNALGWFWADFVVLQVKNVLCEVKKVKMLEHFASVKVFFIKKGQNIDSKYFKSLRIDYFSREMLSRLPNILIYVFDMIFKLRSNSKQLGSGDSNRKEINIA